MKDIGKLFLVAFGLDMAYQVAVLRWFYPVQALVVAIVLAIAPYLLVRGLANRMGRWMGRKTFTRESREEGQ